MTKGQATVLSGSDGLHERLTEVRDLLRAEFGLIVKSDATDGIYTVLAACGASGANLPVVGEPVRVTPDLAVRGMTQSLHHLIVRSTVRNLVTTSPSAVATRLGRGAAVEYVIFGSTLADNDYSGIRRAASERDAVALGEALKLQEVSGALARERNLTDALQRLFEQQTSTMGLAEVVDVLLGSVQSLIGSDVAYFAMPERPESEVFTFSNFRNIETMPFRLLRMSSGRGLGGLARDELTTVRSMNYAEDDRLREAPVRETLGEGILSAMSSPITTQDGITGLIYVGNRHFTPFTDGDVELLERFTSAASTVIEEHIGADYRIEAIRRREREEIAYQLHDTVIRSLVELGIHVDEARFGESDQQAAQHLDQAGQAANDCLTRLRDHLACLVDEPRADTFMSADEVLSALRMGSVSRGGRRVIELVGARPDVEIPAAIGQALIRVGQEALSNAEIHSGCSMASAKLYLDEAEITLTVLDNGSFPDAPVVLDGPGRRGHLGMRAMRAVMARVGGSVSIVHIRGEGTTVRARVALPWNPLNLDRGGLL